LVQTVGSVAQILQTTEKRLWYGFDDNEEAEDYKELEKIMKTIKTQLANELP
jgi:hypothetical protein